MLPLPAAWALVSESGTPIKSIELNCLFAYYNFFHRNIFDVEYLFFNSQFILQPAAGTQVDGRLMNNINYLFDRKTEASIKTIDCWIVELMKYLYIVQSFSWPSSAHPLNANSCVRTFSPQLRWTVIKWLALHFDCTVLVRRSTVLYAGQL